jgi:hypothetical protein
MTPKQDEIKEFELDILKRLIFIMKKEGFKPTKPDLPILKRLVTHVPDYNIRKMILLLQFQLEFDGKLSEGMFETNTGLAFELLDLIKLGKEKEVRKKVMEIDTSTFQKFLFDYSFEIFKDEKQKVMGKMMGEYNLTIPAGTDEKIGLYGLCCDLMIMDKKQKIFVG